MNVCNGVRRNYITSVSPSCTMTVNAHLNIVKEKLPYNKTNENTRKLSTSANKG
jgi:hypothetical protein